MTIDEIMGIGKKVYHVLMIIWFLLICSISFGNWIGKIRFGLGLGDLVYQVVLALSIIIVGTVYALHLSLLMRSSSWDGRSFF